MAFRGKTVEPIDEALRMQRPVLGQGVQLGVDELVTFSIEIRQADPVGINALFGKVFAHGRQPDRFVFPF